MKSNRRRWIGAAFALLLTAGCAVTDLVPPDYTGPLASIGDSAVAQSANRAHFFYVASVDDQAVENSLIVSRRANAGRGFSMLTLPYQRDIPARPVTLTLAAEVAYGAPIEAMFNAKTLYTAKRRVSFTPQANAVYVVKGELTANRQAVWLEKADGEQVVLIDQPAPKRK